MTWHFDHINGMPVLRRRARGLDQIIWKPKYNNGYHYTTHAPAVDDFAMNTWWASNIESVKNHADIVLTYGGALDYEDHRDELEEQRIEATDEAIARSKRDACIHGLWGHPGVGKV